MHGNRTNFKKGGMKTFHYTKPPTSLAVLAAIAIKCSKKGGLTSDQICKFISDTFPHYNSAVCNWRSQLQNSLTTRKWFKKVGIPSKGGRPVYDSQWIIDVSNAADLDGILNKILNHRMDDFRKSMSSSKQLDALRLAMETSVPSVTDLKQEDEASEPEMSGEDERMNEELEDKAGPSIVSMDNKDTENKNGETNIPTDSLATSTTADEDVSKEEAVLLESKSPQQQESYESSDKHQTAADEAGEQDSTKVKNLCRLCADIAGRGTSMLAPDRQKLAKWVTENLNLKDPINNENRLPYKLCVKCLSFIQKWIMYTLRVKSSQKYFKNLLRSEDEEISQNKTKKTPKLEDTTYSIVDINSVTNENSCPENVVHVDVNNAAVNNDVNSVQNQSHDSKVNLNHFVSRVDETLVQTCKIDNNNKSNIKKTDGDTSVAITNKQEIVSKEEEVDKKQETHQTIPITLKRKRGRPRKVVKNSEPAKIVSSKLNQTVVKIEEIETGIETPTDLQVQQPKLRRYESRNRVPSIVTTEVRKSHRVVKPRFVDDSFAFSAILEDMLYDSDYSMDDDDYTCAPSKNIKPPRKTKTNESNKRKISSKQSVKSNSKVLKLQEKEKFSSKLKSKNTKSNDSNKNHSDFYSLPGTSKSNLYSSDGNVITESIEIENSRTDNLSNDESSDCDKLNIALEESKSPDNVDHPSDDSGNENQMGNDSSVEPESPENIDHPSDDSENEMDNNSFEGPDNIDHPSNDSESETGGKVEEDESSESLPNEVLTDIIREVEECRETKGNGPDGTSTCEGEVGPRDQNSLEETDTTPNKECSQGKQAISTKSIENQSPMAIPLHISWENGTNSEAAGNSNPENNLQETEKLSQENLKLPKILIENEVSIPQTSFQISPHNQIIIPMSNELSESQQNSPLAILSQVATLNQTSNLDQHKIKHENSNGDQKSCKPSTLKKISPKKSVKEEIIESSHTNPVSQYENDQKNLSNQTSNIGEMSQQCQTSAQTLISPQPQITNMYLPGNMYLPHLSMISQIPNQTYPLSSAQISSQPMAPTPQSSNHIIQTAQQIPQNYEQNQVNPTATSIPVQQVPNIQVRYALLDSQNAMAVQNPSTSTQISSLAPQASNAYQIIQPAQQNCEQIQINPQSNISQELAPPVHNTEIRYALLQPQNTPISLSKNSDTVQNIQYPILQNPIQSPQTRAYVSIAPNSVFRNVQPSPTSTATLRPKILSPMRMNFQQIYVPQSCETTKVPTQILINNTQNKNSNNTNNNNNNNNSTKTNVLPPPTPVKKQTRPIPIKPYIPQATRQPEKLLPKPQMPGTTVQTYVRSAEDRNKYYLVPPNVPLSNIVPPTASNIPQSNWNGNKNIITSTNTSQSNWNTNIITPIPQNPTQNSWHTGGIPMQIWNNGNIPTQHVPYTPYMSAISNQIPIQTQWSRDTPIPQYALQVPWGGGNLIPQVAYWQQQQQQQQPVHQIAMPTYDGTVLQNQQQHNVMQIPWTGFHVPAVEQTTQHQEPQNSGEQ